MTGGNGMGTCTGLLHNRLVVTCVSKTGIGLTASIVHSEPEVHIHS